MTSKYLMDCQHLTDNEQSQTFLWDTLWEAEQAVMRRRRCDARQVFRYTITPVSYDSGRWVPVVSVEGEQVFGCLPTGR